MVELNLIFVGFLCSLCFLLILFLCFVLIDSIRDFVVKRKELKEDFLYEHKCLCSQVQKLIDYIVYDNECSVKDDD